MEFSDFQCPACKIYNERIDPQFQKLYVDTGKVRFVARHFPFLGPESFTAAEAAEAAAEQGKFWAYTALLWERQGAENSGAFSVTRLKQYASELGLDRKAFDEALDSGKHRAKVLEQKREGEALGINATPNFVVNGKKVQGVPSLATWATILDRELEGKQ
jgi:protein-disulfide isomerase